MTVKLLTEHHLEFLSLKRGFAGSSESTLVKTPHCWRSHAMARMIYYLGLDVRKPDIIVCKQQRCRNLDSLISTFTGKVN